MTFAPDDKKAPAVLTRRAMIAASATSALGLAACSDMTRFTGGPRAEAPPPAVEAPPPGQTIGTGGVKVGLLLPLGAGGNAQIAAQSLKNAAELAVAEFTNSNLQLIVKDDGGSAQGAQTAAQQVIDEGAEMIIGPLFAVSVRAAAGVARGRNVPILAFSTDTNVAARGVYLLSFLPEGDVNRIVEYAAGQGKRAIAAAVPDNAYGQVVQGALQEAAGRRGVRIVGLERYPADRARMQEPLARLAPAVAQADALFLPDSVDAAPLVAQGLQQAGADLKRVTLLGSGLWDDPRLARATALHGGLYPAADAAGFRNFAGRYRAKFNADPERKATLAYDAVSLVAALSRTQGTQRFNDAVLTNANGFNGVDGLFRLRADGTNERGLAVLQAGPQGGRIVAAAPRSFTGV